MNIIRIIAVNKIIQILIKPNINNIILAIIQLLKMLYILQTYNTYKYLLYIVSFMQVTLIVDVAQYLHC